MNIYNIKFFKKVSNKKHPGSFLSIMNQREAKLILNLKDNVNSKTIKQAHLKLMLLNHPDSGKNIFSKQNY